MTMETPPGDPVKIFAQILDGTIACLTAGTMDVPQDELHQEILLPLLPAMVADSVIRQYWQSQATTGFFPTLRAHLETGESRPEWAARDFEVHVAASFAAGPDAKALADTLLSEESLRDLTAGLMNQALTLAWPAVSKSVKVVPPETPCDESISEPEGKAPKAAVVAQVTTAEEVASPTASQEPVGWMPTIRPKPWQTARNPLAGAQKTETISGSAWSKTNPLERNREDYK